MAWCNRKAPSVTPTPDEERTVKTEGLWEKCDGCGQIIWKKELDDALLVCTKCGYPFRRSAEERLQMPFDDGVYETFEPGLRSTDPLDFVASKSYKDRLTAMQESTGHADA